MVSGASYTQASNIMLLSLCSVRETNSQGLSASLGGVTTETQFQRILLDNVLT